MIIAAVYMLCRRLYLGLKPQVVIDFEKLQCIVVYLTEV